MPNFTQEELEIMRAELDASFAANNISQEEYDKRMNSVDFMIMIVDNENAN